MTKMQDCYFVVCDYGKLGRESVINWERCSKENVIEDLLAGGLKNPIEVHYIDREFGMWQDVTQEIAQEIIDRMDYEPKGALFDFLEGALGSRTMADLGRESFEGVAR